MAEKSFVTVDGRRLQKIGKVPYRQIDMVVDRLHISLSMGDVVEVVAKAARADARWTAKLIGHACEYAKARHADNIATYSRIMRGSY